MLPFLELDSAIVKDMITVNITAATYLCHQVTNLDDHDDDIKDYTNDHDNEDDITGAKYLDDNDDLDAVKDDTFRLSFKDHSKLTLYLDMDIILFLSFCQQ